MGKSLSNGAGKKKGNCRRVFMKRVRIQDFCKKESEQDFAEVGTAEWCERRKFEPQSWCLRTGCSRSKKSELCLKRRIL